MINSLKLFFWDNMARGSLQMLNGYRSHQLVFSKKLIIPNIMKDTLSALEGTSSEILTNLVDALHAARNVFIQTELS